MTTLAEAIQACLDKAEWGYHELTDAEAQEIAGTIYRWFEERGVDVVAALADNMPADQELEAARCPTCDSASVSEISATNKTCTSCGSRWRDADMEPARVQQIPCPACGSPHTTFRYCSRTDDPHFDRRCDTCTYTWQTDDVLFARDSQAADR